MNLSRYNLDLATVELGDCDLNRALAEFEICYSEGLKVYSSGDEALAATSFTLYRSDEDSIGVVCDGADDVAIISTRIVDDRGFFASLVRRMDTFRIEVSRQGAMDVIKDYFELTRRDFEQKYQPYLCW